MTKSFKLFAIAVATALILSGCSVAGATTDAEAQSTGSAEAEAAASENQGSGDTEGGAEAETHGQPLDWELTDFEREGILEGYSNVSTYDSETGELIRESLGDGSGYEVGEPVREYSYMSDRGLVWDYAYLYPIYEDGSLIAFVDLVVNSANELPEDTRPVAYEGSEGLYWGIGGKVEEGAQIDMHSGIYSIEALKNQGAQAVSFIFAGDGLWFFDGSELVLVDDDAMGYGGVPRSEQGYASLGDVSDMSIFDDIVLSNPSHVVPLG